MKYLLFLSILLCAVQLDGSNCELPADSGPCKGAFLRYYYDTDMGDCKTFTYGGCLGNANNYTTYELCIEACGTVCQLPKVVGPCRAIIPRFYFDQGAQDCIAFNYGGCGGNANNYSTYELCVESCGTPCLLPVDAGIGLAALPRFYFDKEEGQCKEFTYSGAGGNANNYETMALCMSACGEACYLPPEPGPCLAIIPRWYYDYDEQTCKAFNYGGCGGNKNNHMSFDLCMSSCAPICKQPKYSGQCAAFFTRWYYDESMGQCFSFTYGGCQANGNNFLTLEACNNRCPCTKSYHDDQLHVAPTKKYVFADSSISSVSIVEKFGNLSYSANEFVTFFPGFQVDSLGQLEVAMEGCIN